MYSPMSNRHNPNLPKVLSCLLILLILALFYQHYSNKQVQGVLERDITISQQRAKQVEKELDAIQKGLQLDLNKEKSENEKMKSELQQIKFSMENMQQVQTSKERTCQEYYEELQGCRSEKKVADQNMNDLQGELDRASSERQQLGSQIEQLQAKLNQKTAELQQLSGKVQNPLGGYQNQQQQANNQYQQYRQNQQMAGGQPNYGGNLNQQQFNNQFPINKNMLPNNQLQYDGNRNLANNNQKAFYLGNQQQMLQQPQQQMNYNGRLNYNQSDKQMANAPGVNPMNPMNQFGGQNNRDESENVPNEIPANWRGQDHGEAGGPQEQVASKEDAANKENANGNVGPMPLDPNAAGQMAGEEGKAMEAPKQIGAPAGGNQPQNAAEVDHVAGDGQGALLPPMGDAERKAMEQRINGGGAGAGAPPPEDGEEEEENGDNEIEVNKRGGDGNENDLIPEPVVKDDNLPNDKLDFQIGQPEDNQPIEANIQDPIDGNDQLFDDNVQNANKIDLVNHQDLNNPIMADNVVNNEERDLLNNDFNDANDKDINNIPDFEQN